MIRRRLFIKNTIKLCVLIPLINNISFSKTNKFENHILSQNFLAMGTIGKIKIITKEKKKGIKTINEIINKILYLEKNLTKFSTESFIGKINNNQKKEFITPNYITYILTISEILKKKTNQKFNIALNIQNKEFLKKQSPIKIKKNKTLLDNNYKIDLGGIAKGFAVEESMKIINKYEIKNALIELGGDIKAKGKNKNNELWKIKINTNTKNIKNNFITLDNESIASSGQFIKNIITKEYNIKKHIIDPTTMSNKNYYNLTTVYGPNATICDALATACFNTPIQEIKILKKNFPTYKIITFI